MSWTPNFERAVRVPTFFAAVTALQKSISQKKASRQPRLLFGSTRKACVRTRVFWPETSPSPCDHSRSPHDYPASWMYPEPFARHFVLLVTALTRSSCFIEIPSINPCSHGTDRESPPHPHPLPPSLPRTHPKLTKKSIQRGIELAHEGARGGDAPEEREETTHRHGSSAPDHSQRDKEALRRARPGEGTVGRGTQTGDRQAGDAGVAATDLGIGCRTAEMAERHPVARGESYGGRIPPRSWRSLRGSARGGTGVSNVVAVPTRGLTVGQSSSTDPGLSADQPARRESLVDRDLGPERRVGGTGPRWPRIASSIHERAPFVNKRWKRGGGRAGQTRTLSRLQKAGQERRLPGNGSTWRPRAKRAPFPPARGSA